MSRKSGAAMFFASFVRWWGIERSAEAIVLIECSVTAA